MTRCPRRHSTQLKLQLAHAYLNGEGSLKAITKQHDISHALLIENLTEYKAHIAALEHKVGQLVMKLDVLKKKETTLSIGVRRSMDSDDLDLSSMKDMLL